MSAPTFSAKLNSRPHPHTGRRSGLRRCLFAACVLAFPLFSASLAHADVVVTEPTEAALDAAFAQMPTGGTIRFLCDGTIPITSTKTIYAGEWGVTFVLDATGHNITLDGGSRGALFEGIGRMGTSSEGSFFSIKAKWVFRHLTLINGGDSAVKISTSGDVDATDCVFANNRTTQSGGAIALQKFFFGEFDLNLANCTFRNNRAAINGGAVLAGNNFSAVNCSFLNNTAGKMGGAVSHPFSYGSVMNGCLFASNTARENGGALSWGMGGTMINCTFAENSAPGQGSTIYAQTYPIHLINTIIANTLPGTFGNNVVGAVTDHGHNLCSDNTCGFTASTSFNNADPLFNNVAAGDFRLQPDSPCLDAGLAGSALPATDLDGNPRVWGRAPDMGAYEYIYRRLSGRLLFEGISSHAAPRNVWFQLRPSDGGTPSTLRARVPAGGEFSIRMPLQSGTLRIKGDNSLAVNVPLPNMESTVSDITAFLRAGDVSGDNVVDANDLLDLIAHFNFVAPNRVYLEAADFNGDGANDITDLLLLIGNYNQVGD